MSYHRRNGVLIVRIEGMSARRRVGVSIVPGLLVGAAVAVMTKQWDVAAVAGWDVGALIWLAWTWREVWGLDHVASGRRAEREDPTAGVADLILTAAAIASLGGVAIILVSGHSGGGTVANLALAVGSVVVSWGVVHTTYALKYARLYYRGPNGGVDFHDPEEPAYKDFAYLAFTVGMTFQVSDTEINAREIRATILKQALLSYLFGAVILAVTINLLAGLSK
jgi:uncharacterized membrane protein